MDISVFISDLLFDHDCVMVPGFGGFICNYRPAEIHPVLHFVNPPSKSVSFNVNLSSNDGLLVNYIAKTGGLSFDKALELVNNWVDSSKGLLRKNETVILKQIGRIFSDIEGNIQFAPDDSVNYLKASFALRPITAMPVLRGKEVDFTEKFVQETRKHKQERSVWKIAAVIILLTGIGALIQMMRLGVEIKPLDLNEASVFSFLTNFSTNHEEAIKPLPIAVDKPEVTEVSNVSRAAISAPNNVASPKTTITATLPVTAEHGYYIIIGAFSQSKNAEIARQNLQTRFPDAPLFFEKRGGLTRVGYAAGPDNASASKQLLAAKSENPDYWLLKK